VKLRKQTPAKAAIIAATAGLIAIFLALIRADPRIVAEAQPGPAPDFDRFFVPQSPSQATPEPVATPRPHTRTRAS
jgi:hypothetical protein